MRSFFSYMFRGLIITTIGTIIVYAIVLMLMAGRVPRTAQGFKTLVADMANVKNNIQKINTRSADYINEVEAAAELKAIETTTQLQANKIIEQIDNEAKKAASPNTTPVSAHEFYKIKRDLSRLQRQLDRVENQNRVLTLQINQFLKDKTATK